MERVETLMQQLQQQLNEKLSINKLLITVQMLQHELLHIKSTQKVDGDETAVSISMPLKNINNIPTISLEKKDTSEEKTIEVLQVDEESVNAELDEIKKNASVIQNISLHTNPAMLYETVIENIPTLVHQQLPEQKREVNQWANQESRSVNDKLNETKIEVSAKLSEGPVKDLKRAIGINDRFLYINELFRGDETMYERSIKTINGFIIFAEAEYWIKRELKIKLGWLDNNSIVKQFDHLVRRRFS